MFATVIVAVSLFVLPSLIWVLKEAAASALGLTDRKRQRRILAQSRVIDGVIVSDFRV